MNATWSDCSAALRFWRNWRRCGAVRIRRSLLAETAAGAINQRYRSFLHCDEHFVGCGERAACSSSCWSFENNTLHTPTKRHVSSYGCRVIQLICCTRCSFYHDDLPSSTIERLLNRYTTSGWSRDNGVADDGDVLKVAAWMPFAGWIMCLRWRQRWRVSIHRDWHFVLHFLAWYDMIWYDMPSTGGTACVHGCWPGGGGKTRAVWCIIDQTSFRRVRQRVARR